MADDVAVIFLDTNILLHFRSLREIDWRALAHAKAVRLMLCSPVLDELDEKKNEAKTAERAKKAIIQLKEIEAEQGRVRDSVTLDTAIDDAAVSGNRDAAIIQRVQEYSQQHAGERVSIVSDDHGMSLRCRARGVTCLALDERWRKPVEDETLQKLRKAQQELQRVRNRMPDLQLLASQAQDTKPCDCLDIPITVPDEINIDKKLANVQESHPKISLTGKISLLDADVTGTAADKYNAELDGFYAEYRQYLEDLTAHQNAKALTLELCLWVANRGTSPAGDVRATLMLPDDYTLVIDKEKVDRYFSAMARRVDPEMDLLFKKPRPPMPPKRPEPRTLPRPCDFAREVLSSQRAAMWGDPLRYRADLVSAISKIDFHQSLEVKGNIVQLWAKKISHNDSVCIGTVLVVLGGWDKVVPFEGTYNINTDDHPDEFAGTVVIRPHLQKPASDDAS